MKNETTPPEIGALALDTSRDRVGIVMGHVGSYIQLRPPTGGTEWDARREDVQPADTNDELRVRVAEENKRRRWGR